MKKSQDARNFSKKNDMYTLEAIKLIEEDSHANDSLPKRLEGGRFIEQYYNTDIKELKHKYLKRIIQRGKAFLINMYL